MKFAKKRTMGNLIAIFLLLTITAISIIVALPLANAHDPPWTVPTNAYVTCTPGTVGVNQVTTIVVWLDRYSPTVGGITGQVWEGYTLNITKPDGKTEIIGPWTCSSALASDYKVYKPDQVGKYTIVFSWPGGIVAPSIATYTSVATGDIFLGATSEPATLIVQETPIASWPEPALPTDYWTRPINAQNRGWSTLPSNWLKGTWLTYGFQTSGTGPKSAHVLWTAPIGASSPSSRGYPGGLADAQWPTFEYNINDYQNVWSAPIIMNGVIYYNAPISQQSVKYGYYAVDLYTGQQLWYKNGTDNGLNNPYTLTTPGSNSYSYGQTFEGLTSGQLLHFRSVNGDGVASFLWMQYQSSASGVAQNSNTWYMLDPLTGNVILTLKNVPAGTSATDQNGNFLVFSYNAVTGTFLCWNSTQAIYPGAPTSTGQQVFRPAVGAVIDAVNDTAWVNASTTWGSNYEPTLKEALKTPHSGYTMNVTSADLKGLRGSMTILQDRARVPKGIFGRNIVTTYGSIGGSVTADTIDIWLVTINEHATAYGPWPTLPSTVNTNLGFTLSLNYKKTITVPLPGHNYTWSIPVVNYDSKLFILECQQTRQKWAYDLTTGNPLWGPTIQTPVMGYYATGGGGGVQGGVYDGIYLAMDPNNYYGQIYAYNAATGTLLWIYNATADYGYESYYGNNMPLMLDAVCDGMVYVYSYEHSPTNPLWRDAYVRCINITDGTLLWRLACFSWGGPSIADGYLVCNSQFDNLIYCIGKGPSALTVEAPLTATTAGSTVIVQGTVTDQSPGALVYAKKYGLSSGVAAVSEESQTSWMAYLYEQQAKPANATGVPVTIDAIDPNNNFIHIGDATSDASGTFSYAWTTPNVPGKYTIVATFKGSNSYGGSFAETNAFVSEPAPTTLTPTPAPASVADMYFVPAIAGLFIFVAIIATAIILMLRKRP